MINKSEKGITMITLVVTILLLSIITTVIAKESYDSTQLSKLTKMDNDIKALNDRIATYYLEKNKLPIIETAISKDGFNEEFKKILSPNDGQVYYPIDLRLIDNVTLNYGAGFLGESNDRYIVNFESHVVYYLEGVPYKGEMYYTVGDNSRVTLEI